MRARGAVRAASPLAALSLVLASACAHAPNPPPEMVAPVDARCPLPLAWPSPEQTPRRVRIANHTADTLVVVIDRCFHYTTLAEVPPGGVAQAGLPPRLIGYPDGIRFHAYIASASRFVGSWHVPPTPGAALGLTLDTLARAPGDLFLYDVAALAPPSGPRVAEDGEGRSYLMLPEVADGGFLIFSCGGGRRWLSLSTAVKLPGDTVDVRVRFDGGDWSAEAGWEVLHSFTDALLAPAPLVDSLSRRVAAARLVNVGVAVRRVSPRDGRALAATMSTFGFRVEELAEPLRRLACFRSVLPG